MKSEKKLSTSASLSQSSCVSMKTFESIATFYGETGLLAGRVGKFQLVEMVWSGQGRLKGPSFIGGSSQQLVFTTASLSEQLVPCFNCIFLFFTGHLGIVKKTQQGKVSQLCI